MRDRIFINGTLREGLLREWDEKNVLGLHMTETKDIFLLAVALGLDSPEDMHGKKDGYFLLKNVKTYDKALFASILLGKEENATMIDAFADAEKNYDESERCAESGFKKLEQFISAANGDQELLEKRAMAQLNLLYQKNVATNL